MTSSNRLTIFAAGVPGLEDVLRDEALAAGFLHPRAVPGGIFFPGQWKHVWKANLTLRTASRVLVRLAEFRATNLSQLARLARDIDWGQYLHNGASVRVDATCRKSRINHAGAATQRVAQAIATRIGQGPEVEDPLRILVRIEKDHVTISLDTSGEPLHRRGHKQAMAKAPMRETLASAFLTQCGYDGVEPVVDPMCGSGTFVIEAAERAAGLLPGRARDFAFTQLVGFDEQTYLAMRTDTPSVSGTAQCFGFDRDAGAIRASIENADRAGLADLTAFAVQSVSALEPPVDRPGLVIVNPPYGARIGDRKALFPLYGALGNAVSQRFAGWRVGLVTTVPELAKATRLPFRAPGPPIPHGPLRIQLWQTDPL